LAIFEEVQERTAAGIVGDVAVRASVVVTDYRVPTGANEEQPERHTEQLCGRCKNIGQVLVAPIRWNQQRHLIWRCEKCGHAWTTLERRLTP
jgi:hypothetical protein